MKIHHEEYAQTPGAAPFILNDDIKRMSTVYSDNHNWHENVEIQLCKEGEGFVLIDGKQYEFAAGSIAIIDSDSIHYTYSNTSMVYACIIVSTDFCKQMNLDYRKLSFEPLVQNERVRELFERICTTYRKEQDLRVAKLTCLLLEMLVEIVGRHAKLKSHTNWEQKELATVKKVILYVRENYQHRITLDMISRYTLTDKYTLCKIFKKNTGQTIFENVNAYRCTKAYEHIANGKNVSEAAHLSGFENNSFFTKTFKQYMGCLTSGFKESAGD